MRSAAVAPSALPALAEDEDAGFGSLGESGLLPVAHPKTSGPLPPVPPAAVLPQPSTEEQDGEKALRESLVLKPKTLEFARGDVEREYRRFHFRRTRRAFRLGLIVVCAVFAPFAISDFVEHDQSDTRELEFALRMTAVVWLLIVLLIVHRNWLWVLDRLNLQLFMACGITWFMLSISVSEALKGPELRDTNVDRGSYVVYFGVYLVIPAFYAFARYFYVAGIAVALASHLVESLLIDDSLTPVRQVSLAIPLICVHSIGLHMLYVVDRDHRSAYAELQLVAGRNKLVEIEKQRADALLQDLMPATIAARVKCGESIADSRQAAVMFVEIDAFDMITAGKTPLQISSLLSRYFVMLDTILNPGPSGLEKIKTFGPTYMAVGGIAEETTTPRESTKLCIEGARKLLQARERMARRLGVGRLQLRIGINCGSVVAGVVGSSRFVYDVFGATVNIAHRVMSKCDPNHICITEEVVELVGDDFPCRERVPQVHLKGKGLCRLFYVDYQALDSSGQLGPIQPQQQNKARSPQPPPEPLGSMSKQLEASMRIGSHQSSVPIAGMQEAIDLEDEIFGGSGGKEVPQSVAPSVAPSVVASVAASRRASMLAEVPEEPLDVQAVVHKLHENRRLSMMGSLAPRPRPLSEMPHGRSPLPAVMDRPAPPAPSGESAHAAPATTVATAAAAAAAPGAPSRRRPTAPASTLRAWFSLAFLAVTEAEFREFLEYFRERAFGFEQLRSMLVPYLVSVSLMGLSDAAFFADKAETLALMRYLALVPVLIVALMAVRFGAPATNLVVVCVVVVLLGATYIGMRVVIGDRYDPTVLDLEFFSFLIYAFAVRGPLAVTALVTLLTASLYVGVSLSFGSGNPSRLAMHTVVVWVLGSFGNWSVTFVEVRLWMVSVLARRRMETLDQERARSEYLLFAILPKSVVRERRYVAREYQDCSVLEADLAGFTRFCEETAPEVVVALLDSLVTQFDKAATAHGVEKIKTIGDAFLAVAGLPEPNADHAAAAVRLAQDMIDIVRTHNKRAGPDRQLHIRVGVATGSCVAGVVGGRVRTSFDVWGAAVLRAADLEGKARLDGLAIDAETHTLLADTDEFVWEERAEASGMYDLVNAIKRPATTSPTPSRRHRP